MRQWWVAGIVEESRGRKPPRWVAWRAWSGGDATHTDRAQDVQLAEVLLPAPDRGGLPDLERQLPQRGR
jgi:hypothetical protein